MPQRGFSIVLIIVIISVILVASVAGFFLFGQPNKINDVISQAGSNQPGDKKTESRQSDTDSDEPPLKLKSIGINFEDFKFTKEKLQFDRLFMGYGFFIPASSASPDKKNPQPTYILPLGTPVRSLVDGIVTNMPILWSGDISIQVTKSGQLERWVYEVEHVMNPKVKVGDKVTAGQIIAGVSNFDKGAPAGFGAVEIGLLKGGNPPQHVCPFAYLDETIKEETFKKMNDFFKSWEEYIGDETLYEDTTTPGCLTLDPIEG